VAEVLGQIVNLLKGLQEELELGSPDNLFRQGGGEYIRW